MSRRTYLLSPRFLSIYAHEALVRKFPLEESVLTPWTFLTTYEDVLAAHLGEWRFVDDLGSGQISWQNAFKVRIYDSRRTLFSNKHES